MEIIGGLILIWIAWVVIYNVVERIGQSIRDKAAHQVLDKTFDYEKEKASILAIHEKFLFKNNEVKKTPLAKLLEQHQKKDAWGEFVNSLKDK